MKLLTIVTGSSMLGATTSLGPSLLMVFIYICFIYIIIISFSFFFYSVLLFHIETRNMNNILLATFIQFKLLVSASQDKNVSLILFI